jgi:hypothetical protein
MTIQSAAEFISLRNSQAIEEYTRAAHDDASLDVWWQIIEEHPEMRFWVAYNKTIPLEVLQVLAGDEDARVRGMVARKRKLDSGTLERLATDDNDAVRASVARHRKTPVEVLLWMLNDRWHEVRDTAKARLQSLLTQGAPMNADSPKAREGDLVRLLVDVDGYLSKRTIPRGTDGVVVEAYAEPDEGYAVDVMTSNLWSPEGLEFDNIVLAPEQFELVPHPCRLHVDPDVKMGELAEKLAHLIEGHRADNIALSEKCIFQVFVDPRLPPEAGVSDFNRFRYRVQGEARSGVSVEEMAAIVGSILEHYWAEGTGAVALCDYRHLLPRNGGLPGDVD